MSVGKLQTKFRIQNAFHFSAEENPTAREQDNHVSC